MPDRSRGGGGEAKRGQGNSDMSRGREHAAFSTAEVGDFDRRPSNSTWREKCTTSRRVVAGGLSKQTILRFRRCSGWDLFGPSAAVELRFLHYTTMNGIRQVQQLNKRELENAM